MRFLYNIGLVLFRLLLTTVSPFNQKAKFWVKGRQNILNQISEALVANEKRIWIHAASLGEFEQGRPVIEAIKKKYKEYKIVLTFFSPSGFELQKNYQFADYVFYLPDDTPNKSKKFVELINPELVLFVKYEYWYNYLQNLKKKNIPTYMISSIFREDQIFFKWYGAWYKKMLNQISYFFVQNRESKELLNNLGYNNVTISGDTRFDRVFELAKQSEEYQIVREFKGKKNILIAGSSWKPDEDILINYINSDKSDWKYIIAPHEILEGNIQRIKRLIKKKVICYSKAHEAKVSEFDVLIIDNVGMLSSLYKYGNLAFIGGGFTSGIHNILEAATFGIPVIFGPNYKNFQEAHDLIKLGGAISVSNKTEFKNITDKFISNNKLTKEKGGICKIYVEESRGASFKIINHIFK